MLKESLWHEDDDASSEATTTRRAAFEVTSRRRYLTNARYARPRGKASRCFGGAYRRRDKRNGF